MSDRCAHMVCELERADDPAAPCQVPSVPVARGPGRPRKTALIDAIALGKQLAGGGDAPATELVPPRRWLSKHGAVRVPKGPVAKYKPPRDPFAKLQPPPAPEPAKPIDPRALLLSTQARLAKESLADFIRLGWHVLEPGTELEWNWHIEALANHLQWMFEDWRAKKRDKTFVQRVQRLLVNIPPGTMKSRIVSVFFPAWAWLHVPTWRVICLSANPDVALRDAMYSREVIESEWYRSMFAPKWKLSENTNAKGWFANTSGGFRKSSGFMAKVIGSRADAIIVDDPNDAHEVHSEVVRHGTNERWSTSIVNRVNDLRCALYIGIMQRVHEEDWSGYVLSRGGWAHLCLPMEFEPDVAAAAKNPFGWRDPRTVEGEVLHAARFTPEVLAEQRLTLGSYGYAGQMQQRPAPAEGGMFKRSWWRTFAAEYETAKIVVRVGDGGVVRDDPREVTRLKLASAPKLDDLLISVDCSFKKTAKGSRVAIAAIGRRGPDRFVIDVVARPMDIGETLVAIREMRAKYPSARRILIEDKANGSACVNILSKELTGVVEQKVGSDSKVGRATAVAPTVESGNCYLPDFAPWRDDFLHELSVFPNGAKDDQVDVFSQALIDMQGSNDAARIRAAFGKRV